ncbi:MAG: hypothetical protein KL787_07160 [Taibaiella sp.]|nr:hypothetical protein [Taibaiella sp.]
MTIKGDKKEQVAAELVSVLYDASLDAIRPHSWAEATAIYRSYYSSFNFQTNNFSFNQANKKRYDADTFAYKRMHKRYANLILFSNEYWNNSPVISGYRMINREKYVGSAENIQMDMASAPNMMNRQTKESSLETAKEEVADKIEADTVTEGTEPRLRTNFRETAYFYPDLKTDEDGNVVLRFTLPESLTRWKMMAYAHTRDMKTGFLEGSIISQKELMVQPNMPRFFRQNDEVILSTKVSNLSEKDLTGKVWIEMIDPESKLPLEEPFQLTHKQHSFALPEGNTREYSWTLKVPSDRVGPVLVRIRAQAGNFSDGEEHLVPVLTNRVFVTESMVLSVSGSGEAHYDWKQFRENQSSSLTHYGYTFEYTANPAWYAVQALPYLMEYPYDCSEQMFNKVYANALAHKIVASHPNIRTTFEQWKTKDTAALLSNLSKNDELKSALLQETPWVMEAQDETAQKHRIAALFETEKVESQIRRWIDKIRQNQNADGGWPWFQGMRSDEYITQYMLTGWGKLRKMEAFDFERYNLADHVHKALDFTDREIVRKFEELKKNNKNWQKIASVDYYTLNYMYMRSFFPEKEMSAKVKDVFDFYYSVAKKEATHLPLLQKSQMAIIAQRNRDGKTAGLLVQSLDETSHENEEMGVYWKSLTGGYYWYDAPVSTQAAIIEAFTEVGGYEQEVEGMKKWLLKQKQTQHWSSTIATADACYALLSRGENWLGTQPDVTVRLGSNQIRITEENAEAGTGYFKKKYETNEVRPEMGDITIKVDQPETAKSRPSWGAVYWQYFEDMDKVTSASGPLNITRQLYIRKNTAKGTELVAWKGAETLKPGDRVTVRVVIRTDRDLEYVHLKDMRAAAFEPVDVLSGYQFNNGLGYYRSISDASVNFFFDRIHKGTHVFEYDLFVNASGTYSNGISTVQCMYAPEFGAHTQGQKVYIER